LVSAYKQYREAGGSWHLVIVGDGPQREEIRALSENTGYPSDIHFPGLKPTSHLPPYYAFASAFVLPSLREPWGLVVNEAMAASLPVIVSQRCGCAEDLVQEGTNGFTFDPAQPDALTQSMLKLSQLTLAERTEMGRKSYDTVSRFSPAAWASEVARIATSKADR
jgi:glycosyltransferase involved in cell wall biosynthesis